MRVESLQYFLEIAKVGSYSLAARRLYVSQQGLSKSVHSLEQELDTTLFERSGKRVRLTKAGAALVPLAQACVDDQRALKEAMRKHSNKAQVSESIRLKAMPFVSSGLFSLMRDKLDEYGLRKMVLVESTLPDIMADIAEKRAEQADAAMVVMPDKMLRCLKQNPDVSFTPLFRSDIMITGTKELISPRKRIISLAEAASLPLALYKETILEWIVDDLFADHPFENIILHAANLSMIKEYVNSGQAVTFSDTFSAYLSSDADDALYVPIKDTASFSVGFAYSATTTLDPDTRSYIDRFKACVEETCEPYFQKHPLPDWVVAKPTG